MNLPCGKASRHFCCSDSWLNVTKAAFTGKLSGPPPCASFCIFSMTLPNFFSALSARFLKTTTLNAAHSLELVPVKCSHVVHCHLLAQCQALQGMSMWTCYNSLLCRSKLHLQTKCIRCYTPEPYRRSWSVFNNRFCSRWDARAHASSTGLISLTSTTSMTSPQIEKYSPIYTQS